MFVELLDESGANLRDGVLDFIGSARETKLDVAAYDKMVGDPAKRTRMFEQLVSVLASTGKTQVPVTVELGPGTGAWTIGMDQSPQFETLYAVDISFQFLSLLRARLSSASTHLVCQSADVVEFAPGSVDLVAGRSFLHHVLDYEALLGRCARWLKPDGIAVFFEPCMQGKIWVAFFAELIRTIDAHFGVKALSPSQSNSLQGAVRHILKEHYKKDQLAALRATTEDKWIFDVDALRSVAKRAGFSDVSMSDDGGPERLADAVRFTLSGVLKDQTIIRRYNALFAAFAATFALGTPQMLTSPMVFFVLRK